MSFVMTMPKLGMTMEEGTIHKWWKNVGEEVRQGEILLEILTDKVNMEVEAPVSGILKEIKAQEGEVVKVDEPIAVILLPEEEQREEAFNLEPQKVKEEKVKATPAARYIAQQAGIDLRKVQGSGPAGEIRKKDVEDFISDRGAMEVDLVPLTGVRKVIADKMLASYTSIPHVTLVTEAKASELVNLWIKLKPIVEQIASTKLSFTSLLAYFLIKVLSKYPYINARLEGDSIKRYKEVNLGIAVDTPEGLLVPVIKKADRMGLGELAKAIEEKVYKAREGRLIPEDLTGGTFTLSNLGMFDIDFFTPIINKPEVGILGVGRIREFSGQKWLTLSLSFDHRALDGGPAARFLKALKEVLEDPIKVII
ncbi:pyruvate dehydrogenase E2 component (dihydrolipoamide acetyltransferase) [Thermanaeromonas toyohensis ToBE]|uniref:Dihydrolipoamide acetyltransferase component of pyruvate dehydrogenase complex n=1 Tax=Thermanaeromonas toyohensis ToBE TaxID=698762 RepID=A0A1W1VPB6_9FIRM|nr:dihydrolipoamide acetyltransferase family protein [Thermanaeromonas toyohensis]SMB95080.1 pyruvate dehydrogenase E2 component (dihydrolipoamide acetyltransferase) [Thermanaeromonas toyohensis ToBE]